MNSTLTTDTTDNETDTDATEQGRHPIGADAPADVPQWVQIAQAGTWLGHPGGPEVVTREHLHSALEYFRRHYAGNDADLPIDYHHASVYAGREAPRAPAAGWIRQMELRGGDGAQLWARVEWTEEARRAIAERRYRYISPVFRWNRPDRVTGETVPLHIPSVALTNTPFLTELQSLNEQGAGDSPGTVSTPGSGGDEMNLLKAIAKALGRKPGPVARDLGLAEDAEQAGKMLESGDIDDKAVARAVMKLAGSEEEDGSGELEKVARALGLEAGADAKQIRAKILELRSPDGAVNGLRQALELDEDADASDVLEAIQDLKQDSRRRRAESMVNSAIEEGKIMPSQREFYLNSSMRDPEATRMCLENMPALVEPGLNAAEPQGPSGVLTESERSVCRQLGIDEETYLKNR
ncbi:MAG: phage protease [Planctomycetota bacterium]